MHAKTSDENSQMKNESVVVALTDQNNKPYREYDFKKTQTPGGASSCKVYLPFDSEYKILIKNQNNCRIKIDAELDGTTITDDGFVISANGSTYLERFLSGEGRKFKFVTLLNDGIADPTAKENGILRIKVAKEKAFELGKSVINHIDHHHHHYDPWYWNRSDRAIYGMPTPSFGHLGYSITTSSNIGDGPYVTMSAGSLPASDMLGSAHSLGSHVTAFNANADVPVAAEVAGATVEGSVSDQKFGSTFWNGDLGTVATFVFKLLGKELSEQDKKDMAEYERLKKKFE